MKKAERRKMGRGWKITLISLGSLLGLCVVVVAVALWLVFTPSQLTRIVNRLSAEYVDCDAHFERVNLTLFKTFPDAGLTIDNVTVLNPMDGAPDTLARIGSLTVGVDVKQFIKENKVIVHQVLLDDACANLYIASDGRTNFDIFPSDDDTSSSETKLPDLIDLKKIKVSNLNASFIDEREGMRASLSDLDMTIKGWMDSTRLDADMKLGISRVDYVMGDSQCQEKMRACIDDLTLKVDGTKSGDDIDAKIVFGGEKVGVELRDSTGATTLNSQLDDLLLTVPCIVNIAQKKATFSESKLKIDDYALKFGGETRFDSLWVDMSVATDGKWQVRPLLEMVPQQYVAFMDGMDVDGKVQLDATAVGYVSDGTIPLVRANVTLDDGRFYYPQALPYKIKRISAAADATLDLTGRTPSTATLHRLSAHTRNTDVSVSGRVDDLMGDMLVDAVVKGSLPLADAEPMLPDTLPFIATGKAAIDVNAKFRMSQLQAQAFDKIKASGTVKLNNIDFTLDSIHAVAPDLNIAIQMPAMEHKGKMAEAHLTGSALDFSMGGISATLRRPDINVGVNDITREQLAAAMELSLERTTAAIDSNAIDLSALSLSGTVRMDSTQSSILKRLNPTLDVDLRQTVIRTPMLPDEVYFNNLDFHYTPELCEIADADFKMGRSDFQLYGSVYNLEHWLSHEKMLTGELNFTSGFTDVDHLLEVISGMGTSEDTLERMRKEDKVPAEANPFIVPKDVDFTLHTHIRRSLAFGNDLGDLAGSVTIKDGTAVLDQIGFVCKAATMQLTALYRSPRPNNLFLSIDFHLLDILVDELIDMIPTVDTLVPMLSAFDGKANFHLAAETFLDARYQPKLSSLLGAAAISGKDLVVLDNSSISQIAKLMKFKSWKEKDNKIHVDSLSVEMTAFRNEIEVFPFLLNIGKYQICASGKHTLDNQCGYHIELLKNPLMAKVGVDVRGSLTKPQISLGQVRYADLYRPDRQGVVEEQTLRLKQMIREALENNVR